MILVTGANGLVGSFVCRALADRGQQVRALVRRPGTAPDLPGVTEVVGEFDDPTTAAAVVDGIAAVVTTVAPMGADHATQHRVTVDGTMTLATAARDAGVPRVLHVSTSAVYDRRPGQGDADEDSPLVGDDAGAYAVTKRDADLALTDLDGITRILVRPPAILGPGETSVWNTLRPADVAANPDARRVNPDKTFAWIHVSDLARFLASMAAPGPAGPGPAGPGPAGPGPGGPDPGPREGTATAVNVACPDVTWRDYLGPVADAIGVTPTWTDEPAWTGAILATRARSWGWQPSVDFPTAMGELVAGLGEAHPDRA